MKIKIVSQIKNFFSALCVVKNTNYRRIYYRISSIDIEKQTIMLHIIHKSIFIKQTFSEIISDPEIIV